MAKSKEKALKIINEYDFQLKNLGVLKIKFIEGNERELNQKSLKDFIIDFFVINFDSSWEDYRTIDGTTEANGTPQCTYSRCRSIGDLYRIVLGHYSKPTSLLEVMKTIYEIIHEYKYIYKNSRNYNYQISTNVCNTIHRRVFWITSGGLLTTYGLRPGKEHYDKTSDVSYDEFTIIGEDYYNLFEEDFQKNNQERLKAETVVQKVMDESSTGATIRF